jgi:hypothetical protein
MSGQKYAYMRRWLRAVNPDVLAEKQIVSFVRGRVGVCVESGCTNVVVRSDEYACRNCSKGGNNRYFCVSRHMQYVDYVARWSYAFQQAEWLPPSGYLCGPCVASLDARYTQWQNDGGALCKS